MGRIATVLNFLRTVRHGTNLSDVKVDPGGGPNVTSEHFADPGDDSYPCDSDYVALSDQEGEGRKSAIGYIDPKNLQKSAKGEKRIYGRNASGVQMCEVWLKDDGTIVLENAEIKHELKPDGTSLIENSNGKYELQPTGKALIENSAGSYELNADGSSLIKNAIGFISLLATGIVSINGVLFSPTGGITFPTGATMDSGDFVTDDKISLKNHYHEQGNDGAGDAEADTDTPTPTE